mgnify:FL=1
MEEVKSTEEYVSKDMNKVITEIINTKALRGVAEAITSFCDRIDNTDFTKIMNDAANEKSSYDTKREISRLRDELNKVLYDEDDDLKVSEGSQTLEHESTGIEAVPSEKEVVDGTLGQTQDMAIENKPATLENNDSKSTNASDQIMEEFKVKNSNPVSLDDATLKEYLNNASNKSENKPLSTETQTTLTPPSESVKSDSSDNGLLDYINNNVFGNEEVSTETQTL